MENFEALIEQLRNGEINHISITKEQFEQFRQIIIKLPDFKHFRGEAKQGGGVVFTYLETPRS